MKEKVDKELDRLVETGIVSKVKHYECATPIVPIPKNDGTIRMYGDFEATINPALDVDQYPLTKKEDNFATQAGGKHFTQVDLKIPTSR